MKQTEKKARAMLKDMYFDYKYCRFAKNDVSELSSSLLHDYLTCMEFYCKMFGYDDEVKKAENLEAKWDVEFKKENQ